MPKPNLNWKLDFVKGTLNVTLPYPFVTSISNVPLVTLTRVTSAVTLFPINTVSGVTTTVKAVVILSISITVPLSLPV